MSEKIHPKNFFILFEIYPDLLNPWNMLCKIHSASAHQIKI